MTPGDKNAEAHFNGISTAYDLLSDERASFRSNEMGWDAPSVASM
ncbi:hypothetical protein EHI44_30780 [Rhizobium leguminosarum]|nr:hypothetical protein EHI44_30780 [Rhizobium leguminosarum]